MNENQIKEHPASELLSDNPQKLSEAKIEAMYAVAPIGMGLVSERVILEANDRFCEMVGYAREEIVGHNTRMLYPSQEDYVRVGEVIYELVRRFGTGSMEMQWKRKDGRIIDVILSLMPLDAQNITAGITFAVMDITEKKKALFSLRLSEQRFRNIANYTYDWESWISNHGTLLWVNPAVERITGYRVEECMRMKDYPAEIVHPEDAEMLRTAVKLSVLGSTYDGLELRVMTKDRKQIWVSMCGQPIYDDKGNRQGVRLSIRDVTQRKKLDLALHSFLKFTAAQFGKSFFDLLVCQLAETLEADIVFVGQYSHLGEEKIMTLSVCENGQIAENFEYVLNDTPCRNVVGKTVCCYLSNVAEQFPGDILLRQKQIQAYAGIPLFDSFNMPLGIVVALFKRPLMTSHFIEDVFELFASRTAAEIERHNYEDAFIRRLNNENLISDIVARFIDINPQEIDVMIEHVLEQISVFSNTDSAQIFLFSEEQTDLSLTHLWQNHFVTLKKQHLQQINVALIPWWASKIGLAKPIVVRETGELPAKAAVEKSIFKAANIKSFASVPLIYRGSIIGILAMGSITSPRQWTEDDLGLLKMTAQILTGALVRKKEFMER